MVVFRYSGNWRGYLESSASTVSQNITNNTSTVKVDVWIGMDSGWSIEFGNTYGNVVTISCNGQSQSLAVGPLYLNGSKKHLGSVQFVVNHNANGTGLANIGLNSNMSNIAYSYLNFGNASGSFSHGLTTIPRSSSVSVGTGMIGSGLTININRQSSSFKHAVRYAWGNKSGTIATNVDTSTTWTLPIDFCNDIPNSTSGQGTIFVDTYSGSTLTGTQSTTFRATVPDTVKPTLTGFTLIDNNTAASQLIPGGQQFIQIISNIAVHFGQTTGAYGSTITGYYAEIVGKNQSTSQNGGSLGIMNYNGNVTVRAWVTDSRGRTSNVIDRTVTVSEYFAPVFNFRVERSGDNSNTLTAIRNARIAPLTVSGSQRNSMTLTFRVAPSDSSDYTTDNGPASGTFTSLSSLVNSAANLSGTYGADRSWDVLGILEDKFTRTEFRVKVSTEEVVFSYDKDNRFATGKITDSRLPKGSIESTGGYYLNGKPIQNYQMTSNLGGGIRALDSFGGDLNNITTPGIWQIPSNFENNPFGAFCILECYKLHTSNECIQRVTSTQGFMAVREYGYDNIWRPWRYVAQTSSVPSKNSDHPMLQEKTLRTVTMGFPYRLNATLSRKGDMVTVTLNRRITNIDTFEYSQMLETIPLGYRPTAEVHMPVFPNVSATTKPASILHLASDGIIRFTNGQAGSSVFTGTITYITNDPYPS